MKILLVSPKTTDTFWSFRNALRFISKKASLPPLGLITVAAMLPADWELKLTDLNVSAIREKEILWADYVFLSGMNIHISSMQSIIDQCNTLGTKTVVGGPSATTDHSIFTGVDHFVLNEAEITLPLFLHDLKTGRPRRIYRTDEYPEVAATPVPRFDLLDRKKYASMSLQYSRGCPFDCDFCSITFLNGRKPRVKDGAQFIREMQSLYDSGWRGAVFIVDDNFIGNKQQLKTDMLPKLIAWSEAHDYPYPFMTEVSINLADDEELQDMMVKAGFNNLFVGIETPNSVSLIECNKKQNQKRDMIAAVHQLQQKGLAVAGGFIVGFDSDTDDIFQQQIDFIQRSGILTAMVGLLNAPSGSRLFKRMKKEDRLLDIMSGDNMDGSMNFIPKMSPEALDTGYRKILNTIYSPKIYYERIKTFLNNYTIPLAKPGFSLAYAGAFLKSIWLLGIREKERTYYWRLMFHTLKKYPEKLLMGITLAIYGFHFRKVTEAISV